MPPPVRGLACTAVTARNGSLPRSRDDRDSGGGAALYEFPAGPGQPVRRPNCAPAYYLGRPAHRWITALRRSRTASTHTMHAVTVGGDRTPPPGWALLPGAGAETARLPITPMNPDQVVTAALAARDPGEPVCLRGLDNPTAAGHLPHCRTPALALQRADTGQPVPGHGRPETRS